MLMSKVHKVAVAAMIAIGSLSGGVVHAGGGGAMGGGSTEFTQMMNNAELAKSSADGAVTASHTVSQYMVQLEQYKTQLLNLQGMDPRNLAALLQDTQNQYNNLAAYKMALERMNGSLTQQKQAYDQRFMEAKVSNMAWPDYVKKTVQDANNGNERAKARLDREEQIIGQVNQDYAYARDMQQKIPSTVGQHEALQLLNSQMNRVITQNAQMIAILAKAHNSDVAEAAKAEVEKKTQQANYEQTSQIKLRNQRERQLNNFGGN